MLTFSAMQSLSLLVFCVICQSSLCDLSPKETSDVQEKLLLVRGCPPPEVQGVPGMLYQVNSAVYSRLEAIPFVPFNERLGIICPRGYRRSHVMDAVCLSDGTWSILLKCIEIVCDRPYPLVNGFIEEIYEEPNRKYPFDHILSYSCELGFRLVGRATRICMEDGWSPRQRPRCEVPACEQPHALKDGYIYGLHGLRTSSHSYPLNHNLSYYCDSGYRLVGEALRTCLIDGWSPSAEPFCEVIQCVEPPDIAHGYINNRMMSGNKIYPYYHKVTYQCNPGYDLIGVDIRTCTENGWTPQDRPVCRAQESVKCSCPADLDIGHEIKLIRDCGSWYEVGETVPVECGENYIPVGNPKDVKIICTQQGTWSTEMVKCDERPIRDGSNVPTKEPVTCQCPTGLQIGHRITLNCYPEDRYKVGDSVPAECSEGYKPVGKPKDIKIVCTPHGNWSTELVRCVARESVKCSCPADLDIGHEIKLIRDCGSWYEVGETVPVECGENYRPVGNPEDIKIICTQQGTWSTEMVRCVDNTGTDVGPNGNTCEISNLKNAQVVDQPENDTNEYMFGDSIDVQCLPGFHFDRKTTFHLLCLNGGVWDTPIPECEASNCQQPYALPNGFVNGIYGVRHSSYKYPLNHIISYYCVDGYRLVGETTRTCLIDGWSPNVEPSCEAEEPVTCQCPMGLQIGHRITLDCYPEDRYEVGESVPAECSEGYQLVGQQEDIKIVCTPLGNWSTELVRCVEKDAETCSEPPAIQNGKLLGVKDEYFVGDSLIVACKSGHRTIKPVLSCQADGSWDGEFSDCEAVYCKAPRPPVNGSVEYSQYGLGDLWPFHSEANFVCSEGYQLIGHHWIRCRQDGWSSQTPLCKEISCLDPGTPEEGWKNGDSFAVGSKIQFGCFDGYRLVGPEERICLKNGEWSNEQPHCDSLTAKTDCPGLATPASGFKSRSNYNKNDVVMFRCQNGHVLIGSQTRQCVNGNWTGTDTHCIGKNHFNIKQEVSERLQNSLTQFSKKQRDITYNPSAKLMNTSHKNAGKQNVVIYFVLDSSSYIGTKNFQREKEFVKALIKKLDISKSGARVVLITFGSREAVGFFPTNFSLSINVLNALDRIPYREDDTSLQSILEILGNTMQQTEDQLEGGVALHQVFLITDGKGNLGVNPVGTAERMKEHFGATFTCILQTGQRQKQIFYSIASDINNIFFLDSFSALDWLKVEITNGAIDYSECGRGYDEDAQPEAELQEWPWTVSLMNKNIQHCRGSLINSEWVLTSARCVSTREGTFTPEYFSLQIGSSDEAIKADKISVHPKFNSTTYAYNGALIHLEKPVVFQNLVRPLCLPPLVERTNSTLYKQGEYTYATSWNEKEERLYNKRFAIKSRTLCAAALETNLYTSFCADNYQEHLECENGDCGGPLIQSQIDFNGNLVWMQIGIVNGLERSGYSFFTDVSKITDWIEQVDSEQVVLNK